MTSKMIALSLVLLTALGTGSSALAEPDPARQSRDVPVETSVSGIYKNCIGDQWYLVTYDGGAPTGITPKLKGGKPELCVEPKQLTPETKRELYYKG